MAQIIEDQQPAVAVPEAVVPTASQQVSVKSNRANIVIVVILLILILLALGGIVWIYTKSSSQNATKTDITAVAPANKATQSSSSTTETIPIVQIPGWQTFSDARFDLTFQYPPDWTATVSGPTDDYDIQVFPKTEKSWEFFGTPPDFKDAQALYMHIRERKGQGSQKSFANLKVNDENNVKTSKGWVGEEDTPHPTYEDIKLGGVQALSTTFSNVKGYKRIVTFINGTEYDFEVGVRDKEDMDNILKTVRFSK